MKEKVGGTDIEIWLGHHGSHFHGGDKIEPAIAIMQSGKPVSDAKIFNQLVDPDDSAKTISDETETVFEPETPGEIAHYAQADLKIPAGAKKCVIRFRIQIKDQSEITRDVKIPVGH